VRAGSYVLPESFSWLYHAVVGLDTRFAYLELTTIPSTVWGVYLAVPLLAAASSWLLCFAQNSANVLQHEQGNGNKYGTMIFSVALSLYLGCFVPAGTALYWTASNIFSVIQLLILNAVISPKKHVDYKALEETCKKLQKENKELKAIIPQIKKAMNESVIVNYKLGRIVKLFSENTTTKKEKIDIINRFNEEAKTINETKALYESVKRELNNVKATPMVENNVSTANKTTLNETTIYQSNDVRGMIDLINRMK
jgi:hypothetical protein